MGILEPVIRTRVLVAGQVQGVFFRQSAHEMATGLGLTGWVRNLPDGRVEAVFEGDEGAVEKAVAWCREGPPWASVNDVDVTREEPEGLDGFRIR
jgi:acylphosphatase